MQNIGYQYYHYDGIHSHKKSNIENALILSKRNLNPTISNPDYLVLKRRADIFKQWIHQISTPNLKILDVGGRIQPYRQLFGNKIKSYFALDPLFEGLVDVVGFGRELPFRDEEFDVLICTQVLSYVNNPALVVSELKRVLKPGGILLTSVPSFFPVHHDEKWRFLPEGIEYLVREFREADILPEGYYLAGIFRHMCVLVNSISQNYYYQRLITITVIPLFNILGQMLDGLSFHNQMYTNNYSIRATK